MNLSNLHCLYWSATGNTRKITKSIGNGIADAIAADSAGQSASYFPHAAEEIDFTLPAAREKTYSFSSGDLVIAGAPTYAGKLPNKILPDFQARLKGSDTPAIAVVTYGNRSFDNSLAELAATLSANGFLVIGAAAIPCRHAFSDKLAAGRPDETDLRAAADFGRKVYEKLAKLKTSPPFADVEPLHIPGDPAAPYYVPKGIDGKPAKFLKAKPKTLAERCDRCGVCASVCPMGSISEDPAIVTGICIKCQACIRSCPQHAKYFDDPAFLSHVSMLEANYAAPKKIDIFI
ncbi:MAG TPA: ferredoxin [Lachnospiraceae bacterium]|nr:ferredoxin [Lachnospiraceae bacterium]